MAFTACYFPLILTHHLLSLLSKPTAFSDCTQPCLSLHKKATEMTKASLYQNQLHSGHICIMQHEIWISSSLPQSSSSRYTTSPSPQSWARIMKVSGCANSRIKITESQFGISGHRLGVTLKLRGTPLIITNTHVTVCLLSLPWVSMTTVQRITDK